MVRSPVFVFPRANSFRATKLPSTPPESQRQQSWTMGVREEVRDSWIRRFEELERQKSPETPAEPIEIIASGDDLEVVENVEIKSSKRPRSPQGHTRQLTSKRANITNNHVINLDSDDDDVVMESLPPSTNRGPALATSSPFKPLHNHLYDNPPIPGSKRITDILSGTDLTSSFLFSFQYELDFILPMFRYRTTEITMFYQLGTVLDSDLRSSMKIHMIPVEMDPYTSHHPKLIVNVHGNKGIKVWLLSCNLTEAESMINNQMVFETPLLPRASALETRFQSHLIQFVQAYQKDLDPQCARLLDLLRNHDFSQVKGDFIASAKGTHSRFGYMALFNSLKSQGLIPSEWKTSRQLLYQASSIAAPFRYSNGEGSNVFTHLLAPLLLGDSGQSPTAFSIAKRNNGENSVREFEQQRNVQLFIIFPTLEYIKKSKYSMASGGWSRFNPYTKTGSGHAQIVRSRLYKGYTAQREFNTSHTKFLIMSSDNFKTLDWVLFTSHNISKQAWGSTPKRKAGTDLEIPIKNYETGVLITKKDYPGMKLVPMEIGQKVTTGRDEVPIMLPFRLPPEKYAADDEPWCFEKWHSENDTQTN